MFFCKSVLIMKYVSSEYIASGHFTPGGEAALKDMAGHPRAGVDETAVAPMCLAPGARVTGRWPGSALQEDRGKAHSPRLPEKIACLRLPRCVT
jgi:hypothetical protein